VIIIDDNNVLFRTQ